MDSKGGIATCIAIGAACLVAGALIGRAVTNGRVKAETEVVTVTDTIWREVHDTAFVEVQRTVLRRDTVRLAVAGDTTVIRLTDSVFVEIPIEEKVFEGENYRITADGYMVSLRDVQLRFPEIATMQTVTRPRTKRWSFGLGAQVGYGYTLHGFSPYAGLGATFGFVF